MRYLIVTTMLSLFFHLSFAQMDSLKIDAFFFPANSFSVNKKSDSIQNVYFSRILRAANSERVYNDLSINECYRLFYSGDYFLVVEIIKYKNKYIIKADSLDFRKNIMYSTVDKVLETSAIELIRDECNLIWNINPLEPEFEEVIMFDDSPRWILEYKIDNKYKIIKRQRQVCDIRDVISAIRNTSNVFKYSLDNKD